MPATKMENQRWWCCSQRHRNRPPRFHPNQRRTFGRTRVGRKMVVLGMTTTDRFVRKQMVDLSARRWASWIVQMHWTSGLDRRPMAAMTARTLFGQRTVERSQRSCLRSRKPQNLRLLFQGRKQTVYRKVGRILLNQTLAGGISQDHRNHWKVGWLQTRRVAPRSWWMVLE